RGPATPASRVLGGRSSLPTCLPVTRSKTCHGSTAGGEAKGEGSQLISTRPDSAASSTRQGAPSSKVTGSSACASFKFQRLRTAFPPLLPTATARSPTTVTLFSPPALVR